MLLRTAELSLSRAQVRQEELPVPPFTTRALNASVPEAIQAQGCFGLTAPPTMIVPGHFLLDRQGMALCGTMQQGRFWELGPPGTVRACASFTQGVAGTLPMPHNVPLSPRQVAAA